MKHTSDVRGSVVFLVSFLMLGVISLCSGQEKYPPEYFLQKEGKVLSLTDAEGPLITGVDLVPLIISIMPEYELVIESSLHRVYPDGVNYVFSKSKREGEKESQEEAKLEKIRRISIRIAVFEEQERASLSLKQIIRMVSVGLTDVKGRVGDESFFYVSENASLPMTHTYIRFRRKNVVIQLGLPLELARSFEIAQKIDSELVSGTQFVTRGEKVEVPEFSLIGLPGTVKPREKVLCNLELTNKNIDPTGIFAGSNDPEVVVRLKPHSEVTYYSPKSINETGVNSFSVSVATPRNVLAVKTFTLKVVSE